MGCYYLTVILTQSYIMHCVNAVLFLIIFVFIHDSANCDFVSLRPKLSYQYVFTPKLELPKYNICDIVLLSTVSILILYNLYISLLHCSNMVTFVKFSNNLSTLNKKSLLQNEIWINLAISLLFFIVLTRRFETLVVLLPMMSEIRILHFFWTLVLNYSWQLFVDGRR